MRKFCKDQLVGKLVAIMVTVLLVGDSITFTTTAQADETLVQKLVSIFSGYTPAQIDDAVTQAKDQLMTGAKKAKRNDLEKLFDSQIETLKDRGVPEQIIEALQNQKGAVVKKASEIVIGDGNIPFLPVIPRSFRSHYDLIAMVRNGSKVGYTYLTTTKISDVVDAPQKPYYIYDVEDGEFTRGRSPEDAEKIIKRQKRSLLTVAEVTALATHTDVLSRHYVWAAGSRYESAVQVPLVSLDLGVRPKLGWYYVGYSHSHWGSASCGSR